MRFCNNIDEDSYEIIIILTKTNLYVLFIKEPAMGIYKSKS